MKSQFVITYSEFRGEYNLLNEIVPIIIWVLYGYLGFFLRVSQKFIQKN